MSLTIYPPWWTADITLYNRDEDANGLVTWYRTYLTGCFYTNPKLTQTSRTYDSDKRDADSFICRIRENDSYRDPAEWSALSEAGKATFFTVCTEDIIVPGHVADIINESGNEGLRSSELLEKYTRAGAFRVSGALNNTGTGLGSPHYRATGVI